MLDRGRYDHILDEFEREFKKDTEEAIGWYGINGNEIVVKLRDGSRTFYNFVSKGVRTVRPTSKAGKFIGAISDVDWKTSFGRNLTLIMREKGFTSRAVSELTHIPYQTIHSYTSGKSMPTGFNISRIANAMECSVSELMYFER